jgi:Arc/MetJ-type ribon-helix-helix transcriptional regulator
LSAGHKKTAFALKVNVLWLIERYGLERIGFLTLTFARLIVSYKEAQKALHSLMTGVLKARYPEYIIVMERMTSGRIHYHLLVVMAQDIRTGFDFGAVKRGDYRSASEYLRKEWRFWRETTPKYGFGRTELLPIKKKAEGVAKYVGKYVGKHIGQRLAEDKGARLVRYSKGTNRVTTRFSWVSPGAMMWRAKLGAFCGMLNLNSDNYQEFLREWFGRDWVYVLGPLIGSIKLPEFYAEEEASKSLRAVWVVAVNERERRLNRRGPVVRAAAKRLMARGENAQAAQPVRVWDSWIGHTAKDD